ncbi:FAD-dependent oxidoreductase [Nocardia sp. NPDC052112]|uniref:FAD-dependent oxidoreductase n=1 Tax=Nocardia sp. NPDC052112 TaxID=3155646 RepID=UPI003420165F
MAHVITQSCCNDASCVAVCPVDCIHPRPDEPGFGRAELLHIDPANCIDCGACIDECPVDAIVSEGDLTVATEPYSEINAAYYLDHPVARPVTPGIGPDIAPGDGVLRVAIVGSGPAACYAAGELLARRDIDVEVTLFERMPTPLGLVRFGVAPDHQSTKGVAQLLQRTLGNKNLALELNVEVGTHVGSGELLDYHHAVIYAVGASQGRRLGIPGEGLAGVHSATDFVAWYNGHPEYADRHFDFSAERAVVIGNGNVALDVARILVSDVATLARTDIADHALEALAASRIREVVVVGRRGPAQAAYTTPELIGLGQLRNVDVHAELDGVGTRGQLDAATQLKTRLTAELATRPVDAANRRIRLRFFRSPVAILGEKAVTAVELAHNEPFEDDNGIAGIRATGGLDTLDCGLVLTSVGYRAAPVPGLPYRESNGTIPNEHGRVIDPVSGELARGVYVAGWVKRGPSGVIGTNKYCSIETVRGLLEDFAAGSIVRPVKSREELDALLTERQPLRIGKQGWKAIDAAERKNGRASGRPRAKFVEIGAMLRVAGVATPDPASSC